jgi:STE24 endopeptidase
MTQIYLGIILAILIVHTLLDVVADMLNVQHASSQLPADFSDVYDAESYRKSQEYLKGNTTVGILEDLVGLIVVIYFIVGGGFNAIDLWARSFEFGELTAGLIFAGVILAGIQLIHLPFSIYRTFVIEERFGFNRTTIKTFILDMLKGWLLSGMIGGMAFGGVCWIFDQTGPWAWLYGWIAVTLFQLFLTFIAPVAIMPLFNKFTPLEDGDLKTAIQTYAADQAFHLEGIYIIDGSRRSSKANAFFTGFGRYKRIALFDTLIRNHTLDELVSVLAHEVGHYKKRHITQMILWEIFGTGVMFFLMGFFINNEALFEAFKMDHLSVYASLLFFGFLFTPISVIFSLFSHLLSRRNEYEADHFAVTTYQKPQAMIAALKKLTVHNLGNLTPHPLMVFLHDSHPPVLKRIEAIRRICV